MTLRSRLFATVALPVLSVSLVVEPALAASNQATWLVAQSEEGAAPADGQPSEEELLLKKKQQQEEQAPAAEEPQAPAEEPQAPAEEPQAPAEEPQAPAEEPQAPAEEPQAPAEEPQAPAEEPQAPAEEPQAPAAEEPQAPAEEPQAPAEEPQAPAEEPQQQDEAPAEQPKAEEQAPAEDQQQEQAPAEEPQQQEQAPAEQPKAEEQAPAEQPQTEDQAPAQDQQEQAPAEQPQTEDQAPAGEPQQGEQPSAEQPQSQDQQAPAGETQQQTEAPADNAQPSETVLPQVEDKLSTEEKQQIAEDPSKTADTVVLPVDNGAAVLDSDKDADISGGQQSREERTKAREQEKVAPPPKTDADAQAEMPVLEQKAVNAAIEEKGKKVSAAPEFAVPGVTNVTNNVTNNTVNNTVVNNTVTNNTVVNNVTVVKQEDNRTVLNVGNQIVVRSDDRERLRSDSEDSFYENLSRGRSRETIVRPNGSRIVTIYNRYGDIIQRSRVNRDGEEYVMIYAPEADSEEPRRIYDAGYDLPPMRLTVPVSDYIVSTSRAPSEDYYEFLEKPPVERVERVYSIDEVKYSARIRDKVRRIDLDTITFATGSAEVPLAQAKTLRKVADAILKVLKKDPGETFLIEGHTDAVGSDQSNLVLSDKRAESVASLLTDVYGIPPENLTTQGYGERYLKIRTLAAEQQNRRVTIRRVTALIRPVAKN